MLITTLEKNTPLMFAGKQASGKFAMQQFTDLEATSGWQFVTVHLYDFESTHPVHRLIEHTCVLAVPDRLPGKVPNYISYTPSSSEMQHPPVSGRLGAA